MTDTQAATGGAGTPGTDPAGHSTTGPRIIAVVAATVLAAVVWFLARVAFDVDVAAKTGSTETQVQLPGVVFATVLSGLLGWGLLELLERKTSSPRKVWTVTAVVVFVLSLFTGPLGGVTTGAQVTLVGLHAVAALVLIPGLARTARSKR